MSPDLAKTSHPIGVLNEKPLHADLKTWYARPDDLLEVLVDGYVVDIVREGLLIEIQTRSFAAIRRKLRVLTVAHRVRLVYPVTCEKWIVREDKDGAVLGRRRSPRRGGVEDVFDELASFPELLAEPGFSLELLLIREEEVRRHDPGRWRRRGWVTKERRLISVMERRMVEDPAGLGSLLPAGLAAPFTTADLAAAIGRPRRLAQRMAYCLRALGLIAVAGKQGNAIQYVKADEVGGG